MNSKAVPHRSNRICFFNTNRSWGGGEKWHFETAIRFKEMGIPVVMVCAPGSPLARQCTAAELPVFIQKVHNLSFLWPVKILRLRNWFRREGISQVIFNLPADLKLGAPAARLAGSIRSIYRRGSAIPIKANWLNRFLLNSCIDMVIANSEATRRTLLEKDPGLLPPEKIQVVYNGIQTEGTLPAVQTVSGERPVIGTLGRMVHQKGQELLLEVAHRLKKQGLDFTVVIGGDGPMRESLEEKARQLGLEDRVRFPGFVDTPLAFMAGLDIFVLPSRWEGFGYVLAEAMLAGKPVVAWDLSSNPELVRPGITGFLVPPFDLEQMAERLAWLLNHPDQAHEWGLNGQMIVKQEFSSEASLRRLQEVLGL